MGGVVITEANGQLGGTIQIADGITGIVLTGATEGAYTVGTPKLVTSLSDVEALGITSVGNAFAHRHLKEFYDVAPLGQQLYIMLVANTMTIALMLDKTNPDGAVKLLNFANGKICVLGAIADDKAVHTGGGTITITNGLNADVYTAAANGKVLEAVYRAQEQPLRIIVGASSYSGTASALTDESTGTSNNKCAILLGDTMVYDATYPSSCLGLLMGKVAASGVAEKVSKVKNGPLPNTAAYLAGSTVEAAGGDAATIAGKNFITWRTFPNVQGYFFSGDPMLTVSTDDYSFLARCRVIDKAHKIAYITFVNEVDDNIPTITGGLPDPGWAKWMEQQIINQLSLTMVAALEISAADCFIDPSQNVVSTNKLAVVLKVRPDAYLSEIDINLGFEL